jgi:hypothetical protein
MRRDITSHTWIKTIGVRCSNAAKHGWFVSRQRVQRF